MKGIKTTAVGAVVCCLLVIGARPAEAQPPYTPVLTVTANGSLVTIEWTGVNEALGYNIQAGTGPGLANIGSVNIPASIRLIQLHAPNGLYYLRVRAIAGALQGPFSNEVAVNVGQPGCTTPPPAVAATSTVAGPTVTLNWAPVAGASSYRVEFGRAPGVNELAYNVSAATTAQSQYIPWLGTYYARVVAINTCGSTMGNEVAFTITDLSGSGPREPDPLPGELLPFPSYGHDVSLMVAQTYPGDLANACASRTYMYKLIRELRKRSSRWGANWKRGWPGSLSTDIVTYNGTHLPDNQADKIYLVDVIFSICDRNGWNWEWQHTTQVTWAAAGSPECGTHWCAKWTIDPYLAAGFPIDPRE